MNHEKKLLDVNDVSIRFGGLQALSHVSFEVFEGEILALIGPNGAGKSTTLNVISGFIAPDQGSVHFDGENIQHMGADKVNRMGLARTFQSAEVIHSMTVLENVMAACVAQVDASIFTGMLNFSKTKKNLHFMQEKAKKMLTLIELAHLAHSPASMLTAGQQRLLSVCRSLATNAKLLILDEPGAGLTSAEKKMLAQAIRRIRASGVTIMFVEHDLAFVSSLAERLVVLNHGKILAKGLPDTVRNDQAVIDAYLGNTTIERKVSTTVIDRSGPPLLEIQHLTLKYGELTALNNIDLKVYPGEIVSLIGANGAGKSSLLKAISGLSQPKDGVILLNNKHIMSVPLEQRNGLGISLAPEGRQLFGNLSVYDNLMMGCYTHIKQKGLSQLIRPNKSALQETKQVMDEILTAFPRLAERIHQQAGTLSGGEGQMVAIGRALMSQPTLLMLDEPSFGLAPQVTREILESLPKLAQKGISILLIEQNAHAALRVSDRGYVIVNGEIMASGNADDLLAMPDIGEAYLGWNEENGETKQ